MAIINKGKTFANGEQLTADKLNQVIDNATFTTSAVDNVSTQLAGEAIIVKDGGVTTAKLNNNAVTTAKITDANVTTAKIADANVTTAKIADANVTFAKLTDVIDDDTMATASDTTLATSESIKAYVDNSAQTFTPSTYAGEGSVTFPNGLIMKFGTVSITSGSSQSHTFPVPFPTACVHLSGNKDGAESFATLSITSKDKNGWTGDIYSSIDQTGTYNYFAIGY